MVRKIALLCVGLLCCESVFAQHMDFEGISFDNSLETFDTELVKRGFALVEDGDDTTKFYRGLYSDMKFSIFIRFTQYSLKIYQISVHFDRSHYDRVKKYIEQKYCVRNYTSSNRYGFIYDVADNGWIELNEDHFIVCDNEFRCLHFAEVAYPEIFKKRDLKKWQKKYKNPLFYDENPVVSNNLLI